MLLKNVLGNGFALAKLEPWSKSYQKVYAVVILDLGSSDGVLVCYQKLYSLVRLARKPITMLQAPSVKPQALLTMDHGYCRMIKERKIMEEKQLKRIADILEEILKLIKKDMGVK